MSRSLFVAILLAACAGTVLAQSPTTRGPKTVLFPDQSDLAQFPGFGHDVEFETRAFAADEAKRQQLIVSCMRSQGFRYTPATSTVVRADEWARSRTDRSQAGPVDPNEAYRSSLTPERLEQFNLALFGVPDPNDEQNLWDPNSSSGGGCWGEAMRQTIGVFEARNALNRDYVQMRLGIASDPRVVAEERRWAECMAQGGHNFDKLAQLTSAIANAGQVRGRAKMTPEQVEGAIARSGVCLGQTHYVDVLHTATVEAEGAFVQRHRAILERLKYLR